MWLVISSYLLIGLAACIAYRWNEESRTTGVDVLLDVVLWPIMVYYWIRYGKGL